MNRRFGIALVAALALLVGNDALAAAQRTFVSGFGHDANPCTLAQPCRGFTAAIAQTSAGGEVIVLDSAAYGAVTIAKPVALIAPPGIYAGISVFAGAGITIAAGSNDVVALRNLTITALGGTRGIEVTSVGQLRIEGVHVAGFTGGVNYGLLFSSGGKLTVVNSAFEGNFTGIAVKPPLGNPAKVEIVDTLLTQNTEGYTQGSAGATIAHIVGTNASENLDGFVIENPNAGDVLVLENCTAANNSSGATALNGELVLSGNSITSNDVGVTIAGAGAGMTRGNNTIVQNTNNVNGSLTPFGGT
jgi:hypothetical protein